DENIPTLKRAGALRQENRNPGHPLLFQDTQAMLREQRVTRVAILLPERAGSFQRGYFLIATRVSLETVIRLAAVAVGLPVTLIERTTVRAALGCGRAGRLEAHLDKVIPQPIGM